MNKPAKDLTPGREGRGFPEITIHLIVCAIILSLPLLTINFRNYSGANVWNLYLRFTPFPVLLLVLFYLNYLWLIPRRLFCGRTAEFFFWNFSLVLLFCYVLQLVPILFHPEPSAAAEEAARAMRPPRRRMLPPGRRFWRGEPVYDRDRWRLFRLPAALQILEVLCISFWQF